MTGQTEAHRLVTWLKNEGAWHQMTLGDVEAAGRALLRLQAENLELRKDAERYRWLTADHQSAEMLELAEDAGIRLRWIGKGAADAMIDAAIDAAKDTQ